MVPHRLRPSALCKEISSFSYLVTHNIRKAFGRLGDRTFYSFESLLPEPSYTLWNHLSFWLFNTANPACGNISLSREGTLNEFKTCRAPPYVLCRIGLPLWRGSFIAKGSGSLDDTDVLYNPQDPFSGSFQDRRAPISSGEALNTGGGHLTQHTPRL